MISTHVLWGILDCLRKREKNTKMFQSLPLIIHWYSCFFVFLTFCVMLCLIEFICLRPWKDQWTTSIYVWSDLKDATVCLQKRWFITKVSIKLCASKFRSLWLKPGLKMGDGQLNTLLTHLHLSAILIRRSTLSSSYLKYSQIQQICFVNREIKNMKQQTL